MQARFSAEAVAALPDDSVDGQPDPFGLQILKSRLSRLPGLTVDTLYTHPTDSGTVMEMRLQFDSATALIQAGGEEPQENFIGDLRWFEKDGLLYFQRTISPGNPSSGAPEEGMGDYARNFMKAMFGTVIWHFELKVPGEIVQTNAPADAVQNGVVRWQANLTDLVENGLVMTATVRPKSSAKDLQSITSFLVYFIPSFVLTLLLALYFTRRDP